MKERWRSIVGHSGYEVSNLGRVRSTNRRKLCRASVRSPAHYRTYAGKMLRPAASISGHMTVVLGRGNTQQVHTLVLSAFNRPPKLREECRHLDGDPAHNVVSNLIWGSRGQNNQDKKHHSLPPNQVATPKIVRKIRRLLKRIVNCAEVGRRCCVSRWVVYDVKNDRTHRDIV